MKLFTKLLPTAYVQYFKTLRLAAITVFFALFFLVAKSQQHHYNYSGTLTPITIGGVSFTVTPSNVNLYQNTNGYGEFGGNSFGLAGMSSNQTITIQRQDGLVFRSNSLFVHPGSSTANVVLTGYLSNVSVSSVTVTGNGTYSLNAVVDKIVLSSPFFNSAAFDGIDVTLLAAPTVTTLAATSIVSSSAVVNGTVHPGGANTTATFEYGTASDLTGASSIASTQGTVSGSSGSTAISATLPGLTSGLTYYFRAKGVNTQGTTYGSILSFVALSSNANLSNLSLSSGILSPTFSAATTTYIASVSNATTSITLTPTVADATATVTVNGSTVASGNASASIPLNLGSNTITIVVTAQDASTKTYTVTVTRLSVPPSNALSFDGTDDYVSVAHNAVLNVTKFTLETWFYWSPTTTSDIQFICSKGSEAMEIHTAGIGANGLRFIPRTGVYLDVLNALTTNAWYHIAFVYDPTISFAKIYINGIERSFTLTGSLSSAMVNNTNALNIGRRTTNQYYLKGRLDEFRIWNTVRTQAEIQAGMLNTISAATTGLVAYYNFDAGTASGTNTGITTLTDGTSNALNGTLTNYALTGSTSNWVESYAMVVPTATAASSITGTSFIANWTAPAIGTVDNYLLDVSTSSTFASAIAGSPFTVAGTSKSLTSLTAGTTYYYRVRADKTSVTGQGGYSATITASTISNNSSLSNLALSAGTLAPTFAASTITYTASVSVPSITVTPTVAVGTSTVTVNGNTVTSGSASGSIALNLGSNTITVVVTAQDASTTTYTLTVTRSLSTNANLGNLVLSSGTLAPTFAAATISYTASVSNATTSITVTPTLPANTTSTITVNGNTVASSVASGFIALNVGSNTITTIVTAEDGTTTKTYTVTVTRAASTNSNLSNLLLNAGSLSPTFSSATTSYTSTVSYGTTTFNVTPTVADATATVTVNGTLVTSGSTSGSIALSVGTNTITTIVTAQDGSTTKTYTVVVTRGALSPGNALGFSGSKVTVSGLNISPGAYNQLTISVWANRTGTSATFKSIVSNDDGGFDRAIVVAADNTYHIFAGRDIATGVPAILNSWEYITAYWSGTAIKMYKNGVLVLSTSGENASSSSIGTIIGNNNNALSYPGLIDEVSLWNRELTASEVTANMTSSINVATATGLIGYYTFDQGTAGGNNAGITTLVDNSTGGRNGVLTSGFALTGTATNWIESYAMVVPVATAATNISTTSFTANWTAPVLGTVDNGYVVDVSTVSNFSSVITGSPFAVASGTSLNVSGLLPATNYYYRVKADKTSVTGQGAYTATTNVTTLTSLVWNGSVSNAWGTAANWTPASVPTSADPVTIPTGASNMPVQITATESANGITIQLGASLTIDGTLQVTKAVSNSGTLTGAGTLVLNGTTQQALTGITTIGNLILNNSAGAIINSGMVSITGTLTPTLGTLTTGGNLTLVSDVSGTARIAQGSGSYISGTVKVQQYIPSGRRAFRFLGNPFNSSQNMGSLIDNIFITGDGTTTGTGGATTGNGFDATTTNSASSYWFDNTATTPGAWKAFTSTADNSWSQYKGIRVLVRGDRSQSSALTGGNPTPNAVTLDMTGTLNTGNANISVPTASAFHLISNPYASPVDIGTVIDGLTSGVIGTQYWVWNANAAGVNNRGAYVTKTVGSGAYKLAMNGAFFVRPVSGTTLAFTETNKQSTADNALFRTSTMQDLLELHLLYNNGQADNMFVRNSATALNASDSQDGEKLINPDINLYSLSSNAVKLSLDSRPLDLVTTIPLGFTTTAPATFSIAIASNTLNPSIAIYVKDKLLNTEQLLTSTSVFTFAVTADPATQGENRFEFIFRNSAALPVTITNLKAYQKNTGVQVEWNTQNEQNLNSYEVEKSTNGLTFSKAGTVIASGSSSYNWYDVNPLNGNNYYRIKIVEKDGSFKYTQVVNVKMGGKNAEFTVYPNPVKGGVVSLQMSNVEKGIYTVKIFNNIGQELVAKIINHNGGSATQTIDLGKGIASGNYNIQITNGTTLITKTVIVE